MLNIDALTEEIDDLLEPTNEAEQFYNEEEYQHHTNSKRKANSLHISQIGHTCIRQLAYDYLGHPNSDEGFVPEYKRTAHVGTSIHDLLAKRAARSKTKKPELVPAWKGHELYRCDYDQQDLVPAIEMPLQSDTLKPNMFKVVDMLHLGGRADIVWPNQVEEDKTIDTKKLAKSYQPYLRKKKAGWYIQVQIYMFLLGKQEGLIVGYNRENSKILSWKVRPDDYVVGEVLDDVEYAVTNHIDKGELPPGQPELGSCFFCPFKSYCKYYKS